jgi:hypothetical protein
MTSPHHSNTSVLSPLIWWLVVHAIAVAGIFGDTYGTPLRSGDMEYRWFFVIIYLFAGLVPLANFVKERNQIVPETPAQTMTIAFGLYVFLVGIQVGTLPIDDVRLLTGAWAAIGGGACVLAYNRSLQRVRHMQAKFDEDQLILRIAAAVRAEFLQEAISVPVPGPDAP